MRVTGTERVGRVISAGDWWGYFERDDVSVWERSCSVLGVVGIFWSE